MKKRRCIFCMRETDPGEQKCPFCKKALWQYAWEPRWIRPYTVLKDRYMIGAALGEGAFGVTYLAYDEKEDRTAAVKVYSGEDLPSEASVLEKTEDLPGIVRKRDFFRENGKVCLVMEYLSGGSLKDFMKKHHQISAEQAAEILLPVMKALVLLHSRGILHGDISPDNMLFDADGSLKLIDFGAAVQKGEAGNDKKVKESYAPIEQYQEKDKMGPWSDLYAICAVWYEMVTGRKVPPAPVRVKKDSLKEPSAYVKVPEKMEQVFIRGLSVDIQGRYFSMENLLAGLGFTDGYMPDTAEDSRKLWGDLWIAITTEVERDSASDRKRGRRRKILKTAGGVLLGFAAAAVLAAGGLWFYCDTHPEEVFAYKLEKDRKEAENFQRKTIRRQDSGEFREAVEYLEENAYENDEGEYITTYRLTADALAGWEYPAEYTGNLPVKEETVRLAADLFAGQAGEKADRRFGGYVELYHDQKNDPLLVRLEWTYFCYYGEDRLWIRSDYVTDYVGDVSYCSADREQVEEFLYEMLPVVSPESFLTREEIRELLETAEQTEGYFWMNLNAKCQISVSQDFENNIIVSIEAA